MSDAQTSRAVADFALESESYLRTAFAVQGAIPLIKSAVVSDYLRKLKKALEDEIMGTLGEGWRITEPLPDYFKEENAKFCIWKTSWNDDFRVKLEGQRHAQDGVILGVWREKITRGRQPNPGVAEAFLAEKWPGKSNRSWEWYIHLPHDYGKWHEPDALANMRFRADQTVNYFKTQIFRVAKIAGPALDQMCER